MIASRHGRRLLEIYRSGDLLARPGESFNTHGTLKLASGKGLWVKGLASPNLGVGILKQVVTRCGGKYPQSAPDVEGTSSAGRHKLVPYIVGRDFPEMPGDSRLVSRDGREKSGDG
ncbi:hypothetical protein RRG08_061613 [Elysia crispata]|uniref:Uncharacterized protein n=1 Tax=Elysia crispata TaxID=231223 RepID=A0AAE1D4V9_9GAST|nr:hypothetical protein RRG08_061613 [Elysia crispata]